MSVQSDISRIQYVGNNSTVTAYPVPFYFFADSHLRVIVRTSAGVETSLTSGVGFTTTGAGNPSGGSLVTTVAVPASSTVTIYREVPATQLTQFEEADKFPAEAFERALDLLTMITQQNQRVDSRSIRVKESDGARSDFAALANSILGMDASGNPKAMTLSEVKTYLALTGSTLSVPAGMRTFADNGERAAAVPEFLGQLATQRDTAVIYLSTGASAGNWTAMSFPAVADGEITAAKIASNAVTTIKILNANVTDAKLAANAVTTAKIADGAVTEAKLAPGVCVTPKGYIYGLTISNNGADSANDIDIAAGECVTSAGVFFSVAAMTKRTDALWTVGNGGGGMDAGSKPTSGTLHVFAISNGTAGDILFSTSATAPAMPAGYTAFRRIGSVLTDGSGNIRAFAQRGDSFTLTIPSFDVVAGNMATTQTLYTLSVPAGIVVTAYVVVYNSNIANAYMGSPGRLGTSTIGFSSGNTLPNIITTSGNTNQIMLHSDTNTASQIAGRASSTMTSQIFISTVGWIDTRGHFAA